MIASLIVLLYPIAKTSSTSDQTPAEQSNADSQASQSIDPAVSRSLSNGLRTIILSDDQKAIKLIRKDFLEHKIEFLSNKVRLIKVLSGREPTDLHVIKTKLELINDLQKKIESEDANIKQSLKPHSIQKETECNIKAQRKKINVLESKYDRLNLLNELSEARKVEIDEILESWPICKNELQELCQLLAERSKLDLEKMQKEIEDLIKFRTKYDEVEYTIGMLNERKHYLLKEGKNSYP